VRGTFGNGLILRESVNMRSTLSNSFILRERINMRDTTFNYSKPISISRRSEDKSRRYSRGAAALNLKRAMERSTNVWSLNCIVKKRLRRVQMFTGSSYRGLEERRLG
jgi:hypothetical protein